jgi:hypothetical protein
VATDIELMESVLESRDQFDLSKGLTPQELATFGMLVESPEATRETVNVPVLKDLEDLEDPTKDSVPVASGNDYNAQYAHYLRCQSLLSLVSFEEGWKSFENLVLKAYVYARRREDAEYRGSDPNKALALRIRKQESEDFVKFIRAMIVEAVNVPKPVLGSK